MKKVFISHIHEEVGIAAILKTWIEETFSGGVHVFVSSDPDSIPAGSRWKDKIEKALVDLDVMIVLCSEQSINRPWINFETGAIWMKKIPIIPLCYLGMSKGNLPVPMSDLEALDLDSTESLQLLIKALGKHFEITKLPRLPYIEFYEELNNAMGKVKYKSASPMTVKTEKPKASKKDFEFEEKLLMWLVEHGDIGFKPSIIAQELEVKMIRLKHYLDKLVEQGFLTYEYEDGSSPKSSVISS